MHSLFFQINDDIFQIFSDSKSLLNILENRKQEKCLSSDYPIRNIGFLEKYNFKMDEDFINYEYHSMFEGLKGKQLYMSLNVHTEDEILSLKKFSYNIAAKYYKEKCFFVEATAINIDGEGILIIGERTARNIFALTSILKKSGKFIESDVVPCCISDGEIIANGIFKNITTTERNFMELRRDFCFDNEDLQMNNFVKKEVLFRNDLCLSKTTINKILYINIAGDFTEHFIDAEYGKRNLFNHLLFSDICDNSESYASPKWKSLKYSYNNI